MAKERNEMGSVTHKSGTIVKLFCYTTSLIGKDGTTNYTLLLHLNR